MSDETNELAAQSCVPCRGGVPPLDTSQVKPLLSKLSGWEVVEGHHLSKEYGFGDFVSALDFVNRVGAVAEAEGHHPDVYLAWGKVRLEVWTHKINGLTESDFFFAAKADRVQ